MVLQKKLYASINHSRIVRLERQLIFYFLYFPFIVASRLSSANTLSKYSFISSYDSSNSLVLLFTSLRKITFHLVSNNIKTAIAAVVVPAKNENILILCI